jgi:hypothetical protein
MKIPPTKEAPPFVLLKARRTSGDGGGLLIGLDEDMALGVASADLLQSRQRRCKM